MKILIDPPHGADTRGKRSPDGRFREYKYGREIAKEICRRLRADGLDAELTVTEERDISLTERCRRVNARCAEFGSRNVCLVSVHNNAAGIGQSWMNARGWEAWTSRGETAGDKLAECLYGAAAKYLPAYLPIRTDTTDGDSDKEGDLTILTRTKCAACLTENLFQDNRDDVDYLLSPKGREAIVRLHVEGIRNYLARYARA